MENNGYIKIYRSLLDWEWWDDNNTLKVFLYLLLNANWEDSRYRGVEVPRGSLIVGRKSIAHALGISERSVRTSLEHLKSTGEVTIQSTNRFSVVTVVNWDKFQGREEKSTSQTSSERSGKRPASDQQPTTYKEYKEIKNIRNEEECNALLAFYQNECRNLVPCSVITKPRADKLNALLDAFSIDEIESVFKKSNRVPWLTGSNPKRWKANFDWIIDIEHFVRIQEGVYDDMGSGANAGLMKGNYDFTALEAETKNRR